MRYLFILLIALGVSLETQAQSATDALRFSNFEASGTARALGSGSALGALGADFSVMSSNPGGLAWFRNSEFTITPGIISSKVTARLNNHPDNEAFEETNNSLVLNNFGIVVASQPSNADWKQVNFGLGLNRLADFNQQFYYEGISTGSIVDRFLELANSDAGLDDFEAGLAFDANALIGPDDEGFYHNDFELEPNALIQRTQNITTHGSVNELTFSLAGNYKDRIMMGATIGVPFLSYREEKTYTEEDPNAVGIGNVPYFDKLEYAENLTTTGAGINLKMGLVFRPTQSVRLGVAFHTPTAFSLSDSYYTTMTYNYTENGVANEGNAQSPDGLFDYKLRTPWRAIGSLGVIIQKTGFLSAEVEWLDYQNATYNYNGYENEERDVNNAIQKTLTSALNIRLGGEVAYDIFRFRGGFGLHPSALEGEEKIVNNSFSFGLGIREEYFFIDLAYRQYNFKETFTPYLLNSETNQQFIDKDTNTSRYIMTVGFKF